MTLECTVCRCAYSRPFGKQTHDFPPRLHNLARLAGVAGIAVDEEREAFIGELSEYYVQTRYPEEIEWLGRSLDRATAKETLRKTEETVLWLTSMLK